MSKILVPYGVITQTSMCSYGTWMVHRSSVLWDVSHLHSRHHSLTENVCLVVDHLKAIQRQIWGVFTFLITFPLPLLVIAFTYVFIVLYLSERKRSSKLPDGSRQQSNCAYKNVLKTLLSVIIVLAVCWTPDQVYFLVTHFYSDIGMGSSWSYHSVVNMAFANLFMNPLFSAIRLLGRT